MSGSTTRGMVLACGAAFALLVMPTQSEACQCLDWLCPWNWGRGTASATTFQPTYAAAPAAPVQTCSYVPETSYRSVSRLTPMTVCRPVTSCDPCTGCPVTYYRPSTSLVRTTQLIPYTTYRAVWSNPCATSVGVCGTGCGTGYGTYAPMSSSVISSPSGCTSCGTPAPSLGPTTSTPPPISTTPATPSTPSNGSSAPSTFKADKPIIESAPLAPIPDKEPEVQPNSFRKPQLIDPENRTTARPILQASHYQPLRQAQPAAVDFGGWRASND